MEDTFRDTFKDERQPPMPTWEWGGWNPVRRRHELFPAQRERGNAGTSKRSRHRGFCLAPIDLMWSRDEAKPGALRSRDGSGDQGRGVRTGREAGAQGQDAVRSSVPGNRYVHRHDLRPRHGSGGNPVHRQTFLRASRDNGKTWGWSTPTITPDYPQGGGASKPRAAHGVLGIAYVASAVPQVAATGSARAGVRSQPG